MYVKNSLCAIFYRSQLLLLGWHNRMNLVIKSKSKSWHFWKGYSEQNEHISEVVELRQFYPGDQINARRAREMARDEISKKFTTFKGSQILYDTITIYHTECFRNDYFVSNVYEYIHIVFVLYFHVTDIQSVQSKLRNCQCVSIMQRECLKVVEMENFWMRLRGERGE